METDIKHKAALYKTKLEHLQTKKQEIERQLIILEEQYNQYKEKIEQAFGTTDLDKLQEIANSYLQEIESIEGQLND